MSYNNEDLGTQLSETDHSSEAKALTHSKGLAVLQAHECKLINTSLHASLSSLSMHIGRKVWHAWVCNVKANTVSI